LKKQELVYRGLAPAPQLALMESASAGGALWNAIPTPGVAALRIPSNLFPIVFALFFGLRIPNFSFEGGAKCICSRHPMVDSFGHHLSTCACLGGPTAVHDDVARLLTSMFRSAGHVVYGDKALKYLALEKDENGEPSAKRGDLMVHSLRPNQPDTVVDVSIASVVKSEKGELGGDVAHLHAAQKREKEKREKHESDLKDKGVRFEPFVLEETGVLGPQSQRVFDRIILELDSRCPMEPINWAARSHRQFWSQALSIAVLCGRARSVSYLFGAVVKANRGLAVF